MIRLLSPCSRVTAVTKSHLCSMEKKKFSKEIATWSLINFQARQTIFSIYFLTVIRVWQLWVCHWVSGLTWFVLSVWRVSILSTRTTISMWGRPRRKYMCTHGTASVTHSNALCLCWQMCRSLLLSLYRLHQQKANLSGFDGEKFAGYDL